MTFKKIKQDILRYVGNFTLYFGVNVLCKTLRIDFVNRKVIDELESNTKNYVLAFWHGTMLLPWYLQRDKNVVSLISKSKDGELLGRILKRWNYTVIRGSSSVGGDVALSILVDYAKNKNSIAITPDGPRGPAHKLKAGAVITAKKSGLPLVLLGIGYKNKKTLKNWDAFQIPLFFTKANAVFSDPIYIDAQLSYEKTSKAIQGCEEQLYKLQQDASIFN